MVFKIKFVCFILLKLKKFICILCLSSPSLSATNVARVTRYTNEKWNMVKRVNNRSPREIYFCISQFEEHAAHISPLFQSLSSHKIDSVFVRRENCLQIYKLYRDSRRYSYILLFMLKIFKWRIYYKIILAKFSLHI